MNDTQFDSSRCYASGCTRLGSISAYSKGEDKKWYCASHFKQPISSHSDITVELNRMSWLVNIIDSVRNAYKNDGWDLKSADYNFNIHNRNDLRFAKHEATGAYLHRLETALRECCKVNQKSM